MAVLTAGTLVVSYLVLAVGLTLYHVPTPNHRSNLMVVGLLGFNFLNIFIALCEIGLGRHVKDIQDRYLEMKQFIDNHKNRKVWHQVLDFFTMPLTIQQTIDGKTFPVQMWSTYALYDPAYQNNLSYGFFIDVGNGYTTILPCLLVNLALTKPLMLIDRLDNAHLWVSCVGIASYWQIAYGTIVYFAQFIYHQRYKGHGSIEVFLFVVLMNAIWIVFPLFGIFACVEILKAGSLTCLNNVDKGFLTQFQLPY